MDVRRGGHAQNIKVPAGKRDSGVGLKLGGKGAALLWRKRLLTDPFPVDPVDTTGAGDCFQRGLHLCVAARQESSSCFGDGQHLRRLIHS